MVTGGADGWLSPVALRALTVAFKVTPAGTSSKVASASCVNCCETTVPSAAFANTAR